MNRLKQVRKERGLTLKELSKKINIPVTTLSNYENSNREPKTETWLIFADFYKVSVPFLQGYNAEKNNIGSLILENNVSEEVLAKELHIPLSKLIDWEIQKSEPNLEQWKKLSEYFKVDVAYIQGVSNLKNSHEAYMYMQMFPDFKKKFADQVPILEKMMKYEQQFDDELSFPGITKEYLERVISDPEEYQLHKDTYKMLEILQLSLYHRQDNNKNELPDIRQDKKLNFLNAYMKLDEKIQSILLTRLDGGEVSANFENQLDKLTKELVTMEHKLDESFRTPDGKKIKRYIR